MKPVKIFLASSAELADDRKAFESFLYQKTNVWGEEKQIMLKLTSWENFLDAMSPTRLQDEYNKALRECDLFVLLFWNKVGMYTEEEFDTAWKQFQQSGKPLIYIYFKNYGSEMQQTVLNFKAKLRAMGHFETSYKNQEGLLLHFSMQLDRLYVDIHSAANSQQAEGINKDKVTALINRGELPEAFEELNKYYLGKNDKLNALMDEFINPPGNYSQAMFITRLKIFVSRK